MNALLLKVYGASNLVVASVLLLVCLWLGYRPGLVMVELSTSVVIGAPPAVALHLVLGMMQRRALSRPAAWIILFASIPLLAWLPAHFFAPLVPGKVLVLAGLAMFSSYAALLRHGISISHLFNTIVYENPS